MDRPFENFSLAQLAREVRRDWAAPKYGAVPYLAALGTLDTVEDNYGFDDGRSIVTYFLSNANTWRGEVARAVKAELKLRLK